MDHSIFLDKGKIPADDDLKMSLGTTCEYWHEIKKFVAGKYSMATEEWNFPGTKFGWSYRIKDKKRVIIYLLPRDGFFKSCFLCLGGKPRKPFLKAVFRKKLKKP